MIGYMLAFLAGILASPIVGESIRVLWFGGMGFFAGILVASLGIFMWNLPATIRDRHEPPVGTTR